MSKTGRTKQRSALDKGSEVTQKNSPNKGERIPDINTFHIVNMNSIIEFINYIVKYKISSKTEITEKLSRMGMKIAFKSKDRQEYFNYLDECREIFDGNELDPTTFEIEDAHEVQLKLTKCVTVTQQLLDKAKNEKKLHGKRKFILGSLLGVLDDFCYQINVFKGELTTTVKDWTQLMKTVMGIYSNASKASSLEKELNKGDQETDFNRYLLSLNKTEQQTYIKGFIEEYFDSKWIYNMPTLILQSVMRRILTEDDNFADITLSATDFTSLFERMTTKDRSDYLHYISSHLTTKERSILGVE